MRPRAVGSSWPILFPPGVQAAFDQDWASGRITHHSYRNGSEDGALAYKLLIQTGNAQEPLDFNQVKSELTGKRALVGSGPQPRPLALSAFTADHKETGGQRGPDPTRALLYGTNCVGEQ